jgi:methylated-DNA-[protein]-cysteine S-methyltransferase
MTVAMETIESPLGSIILADDGARVYMLDFYDDAAARDRRLTRRFGDSWPAPRSAPGPFAAALEAYFEGAIDALETIPVETGGTPFQRTVWAALRTIPPGHTSSYGALARRVGNPKGSRAVGLANGRNPVALIVPCHRVIGADGSLTGYAGGTWRKEWLLRHEGASLL